MSSSSSTTEAPLPRAGAGTSGCHSGSVGVWHSLGASGANFPPDSFSPVWWDDLVLFLEAGDSYCDAGVESLMA